MESILSYICEHADKAALILCFLILLSGCNIPISEDLVLITGGTIASTCAPNQTYFLYVCLFFSAWISAWEAYWIGRILGPKLYTIRWFKHFITKKRIEKLHTYYERFGIWVFIFGRFFPGGVRNALFITSGLGKMPFHLFILRDCVGCILQTLTMFTLGYQFGEHYDIIIKKVKEYEIDTIIGLILLSLVAYLWVHKKKLD